MIEKIYIYIKSFLKIFFLKIIYLKTFKSTYFNSFRGKFIFKKSKKSSVTFGKKIASKGPLYIEVLENGKLTIGDYVFFNHNCSITCRDEIIIGDHCLFGYNIVIIDHDHDMNSDVRGKYIKDKIIIDSDVWVCSNVVITSGVKIGKHSIIASGAVVTKDVEPYSIYGGCPARKIKNLERKDFYEN